MSNRDISTANDSVVCPKVSSALFLIAGSVAASGFSSAYRRTILWSNFRRIKFPMPCEETGDW